jgi:hypothetical protein
MNPTIQPLEVPPQEPNISLGELCSRRGGTLLVYHASVPDWRMGSDPVAAVLFEGCMLAVIGGPNDEALHNLRLYPIVRQTTACEVLGSDWLREQCASADKNRDPARLLRTKRHYVFTFKENTVEIIASGYRVLGVYASTEEAHAAWPTGTSRPV